MVPGSQRAGALGALPVQTPEQARSWIRYWKEMRGVPAKAFVLSEYLPGRDFGCQSVWKDGKLVLIKTIRATVLSWYGQPAVGRSPPCGRSPRQSSKSKVVDTCVRAIKLLDARASGVFSVDLKRGCGGHCLHHGNRRWQVFVCDQHF